MKQHSQEWWNARIKKHGKSYASADLSQWSSVRRFASIAKWTDEDSVADICGGVGLLKPYLDGKYMLVDFSLNALGLADADIKMFAEMPRDYDKVLAQCVDEKIDWIVFCSVFVVPEAFCDVPPRVVMRKAFDVARIGVIGNYRDEAWPCEPRLNAYDVVEEMAALADLNPSLDRTFMPNEFNIILKHPDSDWDTKEQAVARMR